MSPRNSYAEALTPNVTEFGERDFREVIINEVRRDRLQYDRTRVFIRRGRDTRDLHFSHKGKVT